MNCFDGLIVEGDVPEGMVDDLMKLINASCTFEDKEEHVVTFFNNQEVVKENIEFPTNSLLVSTKPTAVCLSMCPNGLRLTTEEKKKTGLIYFTRELM